LKEYYEEDGFVSLPIAADYLHKDNISGGPPYSIKITDMQTVDSEFFK